MSHPVNVEVRLENGMSQEKLIKKFFKKCKNEDILREHTEKTGFYLTKSQKKRAKIRKNAFLRLKKR